MKAAKARDAVGFRTARLVIEALRELYPEPAYAFLEQVADATGARHHRWADALVMGLWPSRGLGLTGIEVKVSRTDWLRELKDPAKAETIARFCDHWFVAVGNEDIVRDGELPENWGLLVPANTKARIAVKKAAGVLSPQPVTRDFLAAILRQASRLQSGQLWSERLRGREEGLAEARTRAGATPTQPLLDRISRLETHIKDFEEASGLQLAAWADGGPKNVGAAVRKLIEFERHISTFNAELLAIQERAKNILDSASKDLKDLESLPRH